MPTNTTMDTSADSNERDSFGAVEQGRVAVRSTDSALWKPAAEALHELLHDESLTGVEASRAKEHATKFLVSLYIKLGETDRIRSMLTSLRPVFKILPKVRTAKIVRTLIDRVLSESDDVELKTSLCNECVEWAKTEERKFLRQSIELRLAQIHMEGKNFRASLELIQALLREVKKLDDKAQLVEIFLLESRVQYALRNMPKARASLTAARTNANAVYCPPLLQAQIDMQSGTLHSEERDYTTAYSYFYEAFESFDLIEDTNAPRCLTYMLLCKVMVNKADDVHGLVSGKLALKYAGDAVEAIRSIAVAHSKRSLKDFLAVLERHRDVLYSDAIIRSHIEELQDEMLEQNLVRLIEPFSQVEISHIAKLIELDVPQVEKKLSQMILDKKFSGILDQGSGCLIVFDSTEEDPSYKLALQTISNMSNVVNSLYSKALQIRD